MASNQLSGNLSVLGPGTPELSAPCLSILPSPALSVTSLHDSVRVQSAVAAGALAPCSTCLQQRVKRMTSSVYWQWLRPVMPCRHDLAAQQHILIVAASSLGDPAAAVCQAGWERSYRHRLQHSVLCSQHPALVQAAMSAWHMDLQLACILRVTASKHAFPWQTRLGMERTQGWCCRSNSSLTGHEHNW